MCFNVMKAVKRKVGLSKAGRRNVRDALGREVNEHDIRPRVYAGSSETL